MKSKFLVMVAGLLLVAALASAQGPWAKKDWKQWSKEDCRKVLEDSPWSVRWVHTESKMAEFASRTQGKEGVGSESKLDVYYVIQLRSSLPIRQAFVRDQQIEIKYDRLEPKDREAVDRQSDAILNRVYDDRIIIHIYYGSSVQQYNTDLARFWQNKYPAGVVPQDAFLNSSSGKKVPPIQMIVPKGAAREFELIFPRIVDGEPVIKPTDKMFSIEFRSPDVIKQESQTTAVPSDRVYAEFKIEKLMYNGQLNF